MQNYTFNFVNEKKERKAIKQYDNIIAETLYSYKKYCGVHKKKDDNHNNHNNLIVEKKIRQKEDNIKENNVIHLNNVRKDTFQCNDESYFRNFNINLCVRKELLKDNILNKIKYYINEYVYDVKDKISHEILRANDKKRLLKTYIYELKKNNFHILENLYFYFCNINNYYDYALTKMFHSLLLVFNEKEEKDILLVIYLFLILLNENNINKYIIILILILNADKYNLPTDERDDTHRLFDHKPMVLKNYIVNENGRYFLFLYFYYLLCIISKQQFSNYSDKIIRICLVGLFDCCCYINVIMMNLIEKIINEIEDEYINYHYIICTSLLKCLCNRYSKIKILCMNTMIKLIIKNNNNSKNYKIIEMLIGYKDPNIIPIKSFYDSNYVHINYLCILFNDKSIKVKFHFYSFLFILLYEFTDSNDFLTFLLPYMFSACFDNYKIFRLLSFLYIQLLSKKKTFHVNNNIKEEIIYEFYPEWSYKTNFTLPLPLTLYYFPHSYNNSYLINENMYQLNLHIIIDKEKKEEQYQDEMKKKFHIKCHTSKNDMNENINIKENSYNNTYIYKNIISDNENEIHNNSIECHKKQNEYSKEYYEVLLNNFIKSNEHISNILIDNKITNIDITHNKFNVECKQLAITLLNSYFKYLYKNIDGCTNFEKLERSKIILLIFYFIEDNITEHIPSFITFVLDIFENKLNFELWIIYMNSLYLIGSYVKPTNYYFFLENYLKNKIENKSNTINCLYMLNQICIGTIETYKNIKKKALTDSYIHESFLLILNDLIKLFFFILNEHEYMEKYVLILQIIHTIIMDECVHQRMEEKNIIYLIILLYIIFNKTSNIRKNIMKKKDRICISKNCYISVEIFDLQFYIDRIKKQKRFENLDLSNDLLNIKISSEIIYEVFKFSDDNINQQKLILELLSDEVLYNTYYAYFLIQYIIKKQTFFFDNNFCLFLCNIIIKIFNLDQNEENLLKIVIHEKSLELKDIQSENYKKNKNKVKHSFLEYASTMFLLYIFKNINIYETFENIIKTCQMIYHLLIEIRNPYSFLFFIKYTSLVEKFCDILECNDVKSMYFCKYIIKDIHINYEKYINNDGDIRYLDNINIKSKLHIRKRINDEIDLLFYYISGCIYIVYYKALYCFSFILNSMNEKIEGLNTHKLFLSYFENTQERILTIIKINQKNDYNIWNTYMTSIQDILKNPKFSEFLFLKNYILQSTDYSHLIINIHKYYKHSYDFLNSINTFVLNPIFFNYFYEYNKYENSLFNSFFSWISSNKKENISNGDINQASNENENKITNGDDNKIQHNNDDFIKNMETFFNSNNKMKDIKYIKYDETNLFNYFKNHDFILYMKNYKIYNIPFKILEYRSIIILLYSSLLFYVHDFFVIDISETVNFSLLSKRGIGLCDEFFLKKYSYVCHNLKAFFNILILLCLNNEHILKGRLIKTAEIKNVNRIKHIDNKFFHKIVRSLIIDNEEKTLIEESFCECINFILNTLCSSYKDILTDLRDTYVKTKHVKRLDVCNYIIRTFL
ncbi:conserved Plasmodium protein, unknown function, putative [Plasmodium sp. gorilla clade G1]|nr:conserved Plasmodium protein, unknown function, putative [Plasmodium sp. gorilla clade G1]